MTRLNRAFSLLVAVLLAAVSPAKAESEAPVMIITVGDSLITSYGIDDPSQMFRSILERALIAAGHKATVIDVGFRRTSQSGLEWLQSPDGVKLIGEAVNAAAIVELGNNDCTAKLTIEQTTANLDQMLTALAAAQIPVLLVGTVALGHCGPEYVTEFEQIFVDLSDRHQVLLYPDFVTGISGQFEYFRFDKEHPNAAGMEIIVQNILPAVEALIAQVD